MLRRLAKRPFGEALLYSKSCPSLTPKLIGDAWLATPSSPSRHSKLG